MEGSLVEDCKLKARALLDALDQLTADKFTQREKLNLLKLPKGKTLNTLRPELEALCLRFYTLDALQQECLASLMQEEKVEKKHSRKRKVQAIERYSDADYEEEDEDEEDVDLFDDDDDEIDQMLFEDCKTFLDWKELNSDEDVRAHWWFRRRYAPALSAIKKQLGFEGRNQSAQATWDNIIVDPTNYRVEAAYNKLFTTCIFCNTSHSCSKVLVTQIEREMIGSHCAGLAVALIEFFTTIKNASVYNAGDAFKKIEHAFANLQAAHAAKSGK